MMVVATSVWVEFLKHLQAYFSPLSSLLEHQQVVAVECVLGGLLQGAKTSREQSLILGYWNNLPKRSENGLWVQVGTLSANHSLSSKGVGLIDAFLWCVARAYDLQLWTLDKPKNGSYQAASPFMLREPQHERGVEVVTGWVRVRSP